MTYVTVKNGTRAGWRRIGQPRPADWTCPCGHENRYVKRCGECLAPRP